MSNQTTEGFFYENRDAITRYAAKRILSLMTNDFGSFHSVIDVGCGVGTWLSVAAELGCNRAEGIEAPWILDSGSLVVDQQNIKVLNLEDEWHLEKKYDLGISLEVAEHLTENSGKLLAKNLASCCDVVLFSAAIPGQGGNGHINEQWPSYWQAIFKEEGMEALDLIRPAILNEENIPWWYRQNAIVFLQHKLATEFYNRLTSNPHLRDRAVAPIRIRPNSINIAKKANPSFCERLVRKVKKITHT